MNLLIVDDEQHAREAIKLLVPWAELGIETICEVDNGEAAKLFIQQNQPSLILTDIHMPISGGIQLMEWLHENYPHIRTIAVSGHNDFEYVRQTMRLGGMDYILKPIDPDQLINAVRKVLSTLHKEEQEKKHLVEHGIAINQYKPIYCNHLFNLLLAGSETEDTIQNIRREIDDFPPSGDMQVVVISFYPMSETLIRNFGKNKDLAYFALINILNDFVRNKWQAGYAFRPEASECETIILFWHDLSKVQARVAELIEAVFYSLKTVVHAGIGQTSDSPLRIQSSVDSAREAIQQRNILNASSKIHVMIHKSDTPAAMLHLTDIDAPVRTALLIKSSSEAATALENWFSQVRALPRLTPAMLLLWQHEYSLLRRLWLNAFLPENEAEHMADQLSDCLPIKFDNDQRLLLNETGAAWKNIIADLADQIIQHASQEKGIIKEMISYIEEHLEEDLSLQHLSSRFFVSREHISRRFKVETGHTLSEHVEQLRVAKAKQLLSRSQLKITEIATQIGYADEKYFSKVFKKQTGFSPGQYRRQNNPSLLESHL